MDRGAWQATWGHKSRTQLSDLTTATATATTTAHSSLLAWRIPWTEATVYGVSKSRTQQND